MMGSNETLPNDSHVDLRRLQEWCSIPPERLLNHPKLRVRYRQVKDFEDDG